MIVAIIVLTFTGLLMVFYRKLASVHPYKLIGITCLAEAGCFWYYLYSRILCAGYFLTDKFWEQQAFSKVWYDQYEELQEQLFYSSILMLS